MSITWSDYTNTDSGSYLRIYTEELLAKFIEEIQVGSFSSSVRGLDLSPLFLKKPLEEKLASEDDEEPEEEEEPVVFTDEDLAVILEKCKGLEYLCIGYGPELIGSGALLNMSTPETSHSPLRGPAFLSDSVLEHISELSSLKVLNLYGCDNLSHDTVAAIGRGCPNLKELCIDGEDEDEEEDEEEEDEEGQENDKEEASEETESRDWTKEDWEPFQNLETLCADGVDFSLICDLPKLTRVQVNPYGDSEDLKTFIQSRKDTLRYLNVFEECEPVDESGPSQRLPLDILLCPKLESFNMNLFDHNEVHSSGFLTKLAESLPNLKHLEVAFDLPTEGVAQSLASNFANLESLVWESDEITDDMVKTIATSCKKLRNLHLSFGVQVTDAGVVSIAENLPLLEQLTLQELTPTGLKALKAHCTRLYELGVLDCNDVAAEDVIDLLESFPSLQNLCITGEIGEGILKVIMDQVPEVHYHVPHDHEHEHEHGDCGCEH
ncbi:RNI-like protein [Basidiobolus meristosporus CBS 931.73]|uniref:RNI-like protein n=1 Tax=Basidiobolus meristosporus CBS 931.73 TaxID=1314790 RepID=A0A1Y1Y788_9FUNG|nr:RNI-like protein [Basidiobolus meristosporus CBS 931.73]|eukprot:ORX93881.1 RNI-like protein [Basidiobolus meristosporus CBS 931.73]